LFVNEVGRTDFFPDRAEEVAGMLYDSIFEKLLPLGDQTLLWPAHGAGSVCGDGMTSREFSTIGYEKINNPALQEDNREAFIKRKTSEQHYKPLYFKRMEEYNLKGAPPRPVMNGDVPLKPKVVAKALKTGTTLLDLRSPEAIAGVFIHGSLAIPEHMLPIYGGYLLDYGRDIILIPETHHQLKHAIEHLERLGYDGVIGYLKGGMHTWETSGLPYGRIKAVHASELKMRLTGKNPPLLLDVRKKSEFEEERVPGAKNIFLGELPDRLDELPKNQTIITFCGSGQRAIIAASILRKNGFESVEDCLGSMQACKAVNCETELEES
jgi:hydroxyacylglutathione hydrolase